MQSLNEIKVVTFLNKKLKKKTISFSNFIVCDIHKYYDLQK